MGTQPQGELTMPELLAGVNSELAGEKPFREDELREGVYELAAENGMGGGVLERGRPSIQFVLRGMFPRDPVPSRRHTPHTFDTTGSYR